MSRSSSGSLIGGSRGMGPISAYPAPAGNQNAAQNVDTAQRSAELAKLVRSAMNYSARQLLIALPPSQRSQSESMFLQDVVRDRRAVNDENLATLLCLQGRADSHALSENIRALEVQCAASQPLCLFDLSEAEQVVDAEADAIQLRLAREKSPARMADIVAIGPRVIQAWRKLVDRAQLELARIS